MYPIFEIKQTYEYSSTRNSILETKTNKHMDEIHKNKRYTLSSTQNKHWDKNNKKKNQMYVPF